MWHLLTTNLVLEKEVQQLTGVILQNENKLRTSAQWILSSSAHVAWNYWELFCSPSSLNSSATQKRRDYVAQPKIQQSILLDSYWEFADQKLSHSKFYCSTMKLSRKFWAFCLTDFCNFLDKSQAICLENCKNLSCKNPKMFLTSFIVRQ